jgi:hypothetical protein
MVIVSFFRYVGLPQADAFPMISLSGGILQPQRKMDWKFSKIL